jgi:hypothetical protein
MVGTTRRCAALVLAVVLLAAGCGNSGDDDSSSGTTGPPTSGDAGTTDGATAGDRDTFVSISGVPGVSDEEIDYSVIGTRSGNPLGTCILDCYRDGIEAYFAFRNDEGGIYGRQLVVSEELDDEVAQNQAKAAEVISANDTFGNFNATLFASGWADLDTAGIPTYVWGINAVEANGRQNIFGSIAVVCGTCTGRTVPYIAQQAGATHIASLGYNTTENSKQCTQANADSVEKYAGDTGQEVAYVNDDLEFGLTNGIAPEVTAMKDAGVDFIATCMDLNGMQTLARELDRQGMQDVVLYHPNTYNQAFVTEAGAIFEGDYVAVQFRPFEADPGNSDLDHFLEWMENTGSDVTELAMVGWINASLAFEGLLAAGPDFSRESVLAATNAMTAFDAGGLINPIDWTRQHVAPTEGDPAHDYANECSSVVHIVNGVFETVADPATPWLCWPNDDDALSEPVETDLGS